MVTKNPLVAATLAGVVVAALLVREARQGNVDPAVFEPEHTPEELAIPSDSRLARAMNVGRRELGQEELPQPEDIEFHSAAGRSKIRVGFHTEVPFIALRQVISEDREITFVVRRRRNTLGLPEVVDNTPVETAGFEYRLRRIELPETLSDKFEAATNRPRLFKELVAEGLDRDLTHLLYDPRHRLEDLTYGGDSLTMLIQPAADPTETPWVHETLAFARPVTNRVAHFLANADIPSAKS